MLEIPPTKEKMINMLGSKLQTLWEEQCAAIEAKYEMERIWSKAFKEWEYEYKYRRGGKTLCALYARKDDFGVMVIFGREERTKLEARRSEFSEELMKTYDDATTYHDGKWVMFRPSNEEAIKQIVNMLSVKRRSNTNW